jgi:hypothetical protein
LVHILGPQRHHWSTARVIGMIWYSDDAIGGSDDPPGPEPPLCIILLSDFDLDLHDPNISWQIWKNKFFRMWNNNAPVKRRKVGTKRLPWLTTDLIHNKQHITFPIKESQNNQHNWCLVCRQKGKKPIQQADKRYKVLLLSRQTT